MLFTSPTFLFLFLPAVLAIYALLPGQYRRYALVLFNLAYYVIACWQSPLNIILALLNAAFTYSAGYAIAVTHQRTTFWVAVAINSLAFMTYRIFYVYSEAGGAPYYPFGASVYLLASLSYLIDIYRNDAPHARNFADLLLYQFFFPVLIAGPVIKYKDFCAMIGDEGEGAGKGICFSLAHFSEGVRLYLAGFFGRVSVAAVLAFTIERLIEETGGRFGLGIALFGLLLLCTQVYFTFSGYSSMARGVMYMLGLPHAADFHSPFAAKRPGTFSPCFFISVGNWIEDYLVRPLIGMCGTSFVLRGFLVDFVFCTAFVLWFSAEPYLLLPLLPVLLYRLLRRVWLKRCRRDRRSINAGTGHFHWLGRLLGWLGSFCVFAVFWLLVVLDGPAVLGEYLRQIGQTDFAARLYSVLFAFSYLRYLVIGVAGLLFLIPLRTDDERMLGKLPPGVQSAVRLTSLCIVMFCFAFSILHFLPQFPELSISAFQYIVL